MRGQTRMAFDHNAIPIGAQASIANHNIPGLDGLSVVDVRAELKIPPAQEALLEEFIVGQSPLLSQETDYELVRQFPSFLRYVRQRTLSHARSLHSVVAGPDSAIHASPCRNARRALRQAQEPEPTPGMAQKWGGSGEPPRHDGHHGGSRPSPLSSCPWCRCREIVGSPSTQQIAAYRILGTRTISVSCPRFCEPVHTSPARRRLTSPKVIP